MAKKAQPGPKATAKKRKTTGEGHAEPPKAEVLSPQRAHALFGLPGPYDPPPIPRERPGALTFWDPGLSIHELRRRRKDLFSSPGWLDGQRFAKDAASWTWRQLALTPLGLGKTFAEQERMLPLDAEPPPARELVVYLILHFLVTGERLEIPRLRCKDVLPSGRRVCVGPFRVEGIEIANVSDRWASPGIALCARFTPPVPRKK